MRVLVTGGAGYIGAHTVSLLLERGHDVVVVDDLVTGRAGRVTGIPLIELDLAADAAPEILAAALREHRIHAVIHFAARKQVGESAARPAWYYRENVGGLANLLLAMESAGVGTLVFSSSAAVYGHASGTVNETEPTHPVSPYGETKLAGEWLLSAASAAWGLRAASLRYFNVAGAASPALGDVEALNLVPLVFERLDADQPPVIFGDDYATPDGTCVRDYVHVVDVADAHIATLDYLVAGGSGSEVFNVGTGVGTSVREMIERILVVAGSSAQPVVEARRPGDPASLVAGVERISTATGWHARFGLDDMVRSAWEAHLFHLASEK